MVVEKRIECLKYATTGDMPPNSKGGAFVHDPKIAGEREVKAEVKLRFQNTSGQKMICDRRLQVSTKKTGTGLSMKTLEGTLAFTDDSKKKGKRNTISTRCSELDEEISVQLGVSKAILDNVIFCHQEESNWPLSDSATLKKKFDEIFDSTKYTKSLAHIKDLRKELMNNVRVDKEVLKALKTDRDRADTIESQLVKLRQTIQEKQKAHDELDKEIVQYQATNKQVYESAAKYSSIVSQGQSLKERLRTVSEHTNSLKISLKELDETDEQLDALLQNEQETVKAEDEKYQRLGKQKADLSDELDELRKRENRLNQELGKLNSEASAHEKAVEELKELIAQVSELYMIQGFTDIDVKSSKLSEFTSTLNETQMEFEQEFNTVKAENSFKEQGKKDEIDKLSDKQKSMAASQASIKEKIDQYQKTADELKEAIDQCSVTETNIVNSEQNLAEYQKRIEKLKVDQENGNFDTIIRDKTQEIRSLETKRNQHFNDISSVNAMAETRVRLDVKRSEFSKKKEVMRSLVDLQDEKFKRVVGESITASNAEKRIADHLSKKQKEKSALEDKAAKSNTKLYNLEETHKSSSSKLEAARKKFNEHKAKISEQCQDESLDDLLKETEEGLADTRKNLATLQQTERFYQRILDQGKHERECWTCKRGFQNDDEFEAFESHLQHQIKLVPERTEKTKEEITGWETQLELLKSLQPDAHAMARIETYEIPELKATLQDTEEKKQQLSQEYEQANEKVTQLNNEIKEAESLKAFASDVAKNQNDINELANEIATGEAELGSSANELSTADIQAEIDTINEKIQRLQREVEQKTSERDRIRSSIASTETNLIKAEMNLKDQKHQLEARKKSEEQLSQTIDNINASKQRIKKLEEEVAEIKVPLAKLNSELEAQRKEHSDREEKVSKKINALVKSIDQVESAERSMKRYVNSGGERRLEHAMNQLKDVQKNIETTNTNVQQVQIDLDQIDKDRSQHEHVKRNINDNISYRQNKKKLAQLEKELQDLDVPGAEKAKQKYDRDFEEIRQKISDMEATKSRYGGEIQTTESTINGHENDLRDNFQNIKQRYTKHLIKVKMTEFAAQDLDRYSQGLDQAILAHHAEKMKEINDTIAHLWAKTYQGTDIDKIKIQWDSDNVKANNRSYNYRVVMYKNNVELDMRGRCSAGQKVLASIIIRLALADSFGYNCGLLALDEPTTNLDLDNIHSLAQALAELIRERKSQSNFQLIIITHDEEMLNALSSNEVLDNYWRVTRDHRQKSMIERQSVTQW